MKSTIPDPLPPGEERDCKIRSGYRIFANPTHGGGAMCWYSPDLNMAQLLARTICEQTGQEVEISLYVGCVRLVKPATEWVEGKET